jgi:hypothetical protein
MNKIKNWLEKHFGICNHDDDCTDEYPTGMQSKETWYWHIHRCKKCKRELAVLGACNE